MVACAKFHCASTDKFWSLFLYFENTAFAWADSVLVYFHMTEQHQALCSLVTVHYCMLLRMVLYRVSHESRKSAELLLWLWTHGIPYCTAMLHNATNCLHCTLYVLCVIIIIMSWATC
jgi:hypothetical protein